MFYHHCIVYLIEDNNFKGAANYTVNGHALYVGQQLNVIILNISGGIGYWKLGIVVFAILGIAISIAILVWNHTQNRPH